MNPPLSWQSPYGVNVCGNKSNQMSYTLGILSDANHYPDGRGRSYVPKYILSKESCTPCTCFHPLTYVTYTHGVHKNSIIGSQTYSKHIPLRSYVHPVHPSEDPCTPSTSFRGALYPIHILSRSYVLQGRTFIISLALHTSMQSTWDDIVKFNHRFSNLFHAYAYMISQISND